MFLIKLHYLAPHYQIKNKKILYINFYVLSIYTLVQHLPTQTTSPPLQDQNSDVLIYTTLLQLRISTYTLVKLIHIFKVRTIECHKYVNQ